AEIDRDHDGDEIYGDVAQRVGTTAFKRDRHAKKLGVAQGVLLRLVLEDEKAGGEPAVLPAQRIDLADDIREDVGVGHLSSLERRDPVAGTVVVGLQLLPGETRLVEEGEVRALRAITLEPEPHVAELGPAAIKAAS